MSNDRELLDLAASAAGLIVNYRVSKSEPYETTAIVDGKPWCPLTDDGDALRLAVSLNLQITIEDERCGCVTASWGDDYEHHTVEHSESPETAAAATRRAIVTAAAKIAKTTA